MKFQNPILPGFYPDPSICRVGEDYYLVTSSFEYFPGVPVFHSRDLVNWRQIGHCLTRKSQLDLDAAKSSGGIYAPTIRHHAGRFYMVTTDTTGRGNILVSADDPAGPWSEPISIRQGGIDPSLFFDASGKVYFSSNCLHGNRRGLQQSEIDIEMGELLSASKFLWEGTGGKYPEAPHLYLKDGWYYLLIAEGGTEFGHMITVARSRAAFGPFEPCPQNPILSHRSTSHSIQSTGHGDMIQDHLGGWWMVFSRGAAPLLPVGASPWPGNVSGAGSLVGGGLAGNQSGQPRGIDNGSGLGAFSRDANSSAGPDRF